MIEGPYTYNKRQTWFGYSSVIDTQHNGITHQIWSLRTNQVVLFYTRKYSINSTLWHRHTMFNLFWLMQAMDYLYSFSTSFVPLCHHKLAENEIGDIYRSNDTLCTIFVFKQSIATVTIKHTIWWKKNKKN